MPCLVGSMLRSIPACAGEALFNGVVQQFLKVYPRVCGGSGSSILGARKLKGLSPRVRGKHFRT